MTEESTAAFWEAHYAGEGPTWSGHPNATMVDVVSPLPPGRALDLGCGEGGDALWLAARGWDVTGVDVSATAVDRARRAATAAPDARLRWLVRDLDEWAAADTEDVADVGDVSGDELADGYDLVTASFFQSSVHLGRTAILRRVAGLVADGGHLLLVSHAGLPSWSRGHDHPDHRFVTPEQELRDLDLPAAGWDVEVAETRSREIADPQGRPATVDDGVVLLRRLSSRRLG